jgi:outer membrane cobalamin receptor
MGGLTYQIDKDTKLFTSVAKKTRFPTLQELYSTSGGNPDLKTEQSVNTTFGVNHAFGNLAWLELAYFYHRISDWITRDLPPDQGGNYLNFGKIRMAGFELNTEFYPPWVKNLVLSFDYMYNRAKDHSEGRVTDKVLNTPLHKFDVGLRYTVPRIGTRLDFNAIYVAQVYSRLPTPTYPKDPTIKSDSQMTFDCRISQNFLKYFEAYMAMNNMLDRDYEPEYGFPAMGRTVWFGLTAKY